MEKNDVVVGPSGIRFSVRGLKMQEVKLLQNRKAMENGTAFDSIIEACVTVHDPGPAYPGTNPQNTLNWKTTALQGDRFLALLMIRVHTHGSCYAFDARCPECKKKIPWEVELHELAVQPYPEWSIAKHVARELLDAKLGDVAVKFSLITSEDEKRIMKKLNEDESDPLMMSLLYRLREVEGVEKKDVADWLASADFGDVVEFRNEIEEANGGVDTSITIECKRCGEFPVDIPFAQPGYWFPRSRATGIPSKK